MSKHSSFPIHKKNAPPDFLNDIYYRLIRLSWVRLLALAFLIFILVNIAFGAVYLAFREGLRPSSLSLFDCFVFSVHTFSTVGYGNIIPASSLLQMVTVLEIFVGMVFMALLTGIFFSKFSQPSARFLFTDTMLVTQYRGKLALVFRVANVRTNSVMDASVSMIALYDETTPEGIRYRRLEDLALDRSHTPVFALSLSCAHLVEPGSATENFLKRLKAGENIEFLVSVRGLDDTFGQTIHGTKVYRPEHIRFGGQFKDILQVLPDGARVIDFANFHSVNEAL